MWFRQGRKYLLAIAGSCLALWLTFVAADWFWPLPDPNRVGSIMILAEDHTPLRAFADKQGVWRYPVSLDEVSPLYIEALLHYEDRWFYWHPGVNPLALGRALWQWLKSGEIISGGSTLTMQVARILDPHERTLGGKFRQVFRALQLEWHYSKDQILTFYINLAPFGGPIEGVQTASYAWLHKSARNLSHAEAALLAVLPQAPSRLRPDRYPELAQQYRDKVLQRMVDLGVWPQDIVVESRIEPVLIARFQQPQLASLFAQRMKARAQERQQARLQTTLNAHMQWAVENVVRARLNSLPAKASLGILVMENKTGYVRAYVGSADFASKERFGHVDMVQALRSPGSTLKPFLYGMALDDGLIHSASLLSDVPVKLEDYAPRNFFRNFSGPVSVTQALQQSLNVPAVDLLQRVTPAAFVARLRNGGINMVFPEQSEPNMSVILGGAGTRLEELVRGFSALAREGISVAPRFLPNDPLVERHVLSSGAAWIIQTILQGINPPEGSTNPDNIAWKTGTSYGFRDAWSVGVSDTYTVGIWTGRPDGTPLPGRFGAYAAGPILFDVFRALPRQSKTLPVRRRPDTVTQTDICWPLGKQASETSAEDCHVRQSAWILDGNIPPTLPNLQQPSWSAGMKTYWVNPTTQQRVMADCANTERQAKQLVQWPLELKPWLAAGILERMKLPAFDASCPPSVQAQREQELRIRQLDASTRLYLPSTTHAPATVSVDLQAEGGQGEYLWLVNGELVGKDAAHQGLRYTFTQAGDYDLTVMDTAGEADKVSIQVVNH